MTLTTRVAIIEPTPVREVFNECRRIIGGQDAKYRHEEPARYHDDGRCEYRNLPGQGLPALLWVYYGLDAPIMPSDEDWPSPDGWSIEVCFDTGYAYRAENGASCSDLHAYFVQELGRRLDQRGLSWLWYHEFNGEWHPSSDPVTLLGDPDRGAV